MKIAIIGGHENQRDELRAWAERAGHELSFSRGAHGDEAQIRGIIASADLVVIAIGSMAHTAFSVAKSHADRLGVPRRIERRPTGTRLDGIVREIGEARR